MSLRYKTVELAMPKQLIITGMHRSGTSLVSSLLQQAGVHIGAELLGSAPGNQHGHFEDIDFFTFHDKLLRRSGQSLLVETAGALKEITPAERAEAQQMIDQRNATSETWGWKDPRTSLFLEFWHSLLPEAAYVFIYRHPVEVVLSLVRRASDLEGLIDPFVGLRAWQVYNESILSFYQKYPTRCLLCHISGIVADVETFVSEVARKFKLPLRQNDTSILFHTPDLKQIVDEASINPILSQIMPQTVDLYNQFERRADMPGQTTVLPSASPKQSMISLLDQMLSLIDDDQLKEASTRPLFLMLLALLDPPTISALWPNIEKIKTGWKNYRLELENSKYELEEMKRRWQATGSAELPAQQNQAHMVVELEKKLAQLESAPIVRLGQKLGLIQR